MSNNTKSSPYVANKSDDGYERTGSPCTTNIATVDAEKKAMQTKIVPRNGTIKTITEIPTSDEIHTKEVTFIENVNWVGYEEGINLFSAKNLSINKPGCVGFFLSNGSESEGQYHWLYSGDQTYVTPKYDGSMTTTNKSLRPVTRLWSCLKENLNAASGETKTNSVSFFSFLLYIYTISV